MALTHDHPDQSTLEAPIDALAPDVLNPVEQTTHGRGRRIAGIVGVAGLALVGGIFAGANFGRSSDEEPVTNNEPVPTVPVTEATTTPPPTETTTTETPTTEMSPLESLLVWGLPEEVGSSDFVLDISERERSDRETARLDNKDVDDFTLRFTQDFKSGISSGKLVPILSNECAVVDLKLRSKTTDETASYLLIMPNPLYATAENKVGGIYSGFGGLLDGDDSPTVFATSSDNLGNPTYANFALAPEDISVTTDRPVSNTESVTILGPVSSEPTPDGSPWQSTGYLAETTDGQTIIVGGIVAVRNDGSIDKNDICSQVLDYTAIN